MDELLMDAMFNQPVGRLERRRQFEARKWKKTETFSDYCHEIILGNRVPIAEDEMVDYEGIIEGIPGRPTKPNSNAFFFTIQELLREFRKIKLTTIETTMLRSLYRVCC